MYLNYTTQYLFATLVNGDMKQSELLMHVLRCCALRPERQRTRLSHRPAEVLALECLLLAGEVPEAATVGATTARSSTATATIIETTSTTSTTTSAITEPTTTTATTATETAAWRVVTACGCEVESQRTATQISALESLQRSLSVISGSHLHVSVAFWCTTLAISRNANALD